MEQLHYYYIMPRAIYIMHLIGSLLLMLELALTTLEIMLATLPALGFFKR
jgi:hypothetical protein